MKWKIIISRSGLQILFPKIKNIWPKKVCFKVDILSSIWLYWRQLAQDLKENLTVPSVIELVAGSVQVNLDLTVL